ncbi:hypothetical protein [Iamia sp.]|uniref:hypothetical protein n=1 Tax=Iamia sp. TaxID=2722710 RepID=UPI002BD948E9|nr:hypothetical protein [Iamia sp.]HXH56637.1 hypothetical protein [Iamia sp.]
MVNASVLRLPVLLADAADGGGFFLGEDLLAYLLLAFGGAMLVGNLMAVYRPPPQMQAEGTRAPVGRSLLMAALGGIAAVWALASLLGVGG